MGSTEAGGAEPVGSGRPLLGGGLLATAGLVDVLSAWADTAGDRFAVETAQGVYQVDITEWAWRHLAIGVAVTLAGLLVLTGRRGTVPLAICCAVPAILVDLLLFPYAPIQSVLVVALDGAAVRLLLRYRHAVRARTPAPGPDRLSAARRPGPSAPGPPPGSPTTTG